MQKMFQAAPAVLASVILLTLAVGLFIPRDQLPTWLAERILVRNAAPGGQEVRPATPLNSEPVRAAATEPGAATLPENVAPQSAEPINNDPQTTVPKTVAKDSLATLPPGYSPPPPVTPPRPFTPRIMRTRPETEAELMNAYFTAVPPQPSSAPRAVDVPLPHFPGTNAVWAGTGRDVQGRVWIGGCADRSEQPSARLFCFDPQTGELSDTGDVVSALHAHGLLHPDECQAKIHSKIIQAGDGHLYFASMDERGENPDGSQLPTWGGHLWRLRMPEQKWEHLQSTKEALIAVAGMGRYVYALGYFGHVLFQFDTETGSLKTLTVGSVDGHVSRNFLVDRRGHAFVPRLTRTADTGLVEAALVEFDAELHELGATKLEGYGIQNPTNSHGITGVQPLADGSLAFVTHFGRLFHIIPKDDGPADVKDLGWMHPQGEMLIESLFSYDGRTSLLAVTQTSAKDLEWISYDLTSSTSKVEPLEKPARYASASQGLLLYGSMTRDSEGAFYLVGTHMSAAPFGPVVWRLMPPQ